MCHRILSFLLLFVFGSAGTNLVRVELGKNRLEPLFERGLNVIKELDNCALIIADDTEILKMIDSKYSILEQNAKEGNFYLVYQFNTKIDLTKYGKVLSTDNNISLLKIKEGAILSLTREPVQIVRVSFKPLIRKGIIMFPAVRENPIIQEIVNKVNPDTVLSFVRRLQNFRTRYSTHDSCMAAANWIRNKFIEYGCDSVYFQYHTSGHAPNVIGIKFGVLYPNIYAVIDGHFDATSNQAPNIAPGADDNASGTVAAIEAARVMKDYLFEYSARFIAFSGEEFGLYGSEYYANNARANGDSILGVLNGDMIAYVDASPENCDVLTNSANIPFADFFIACADTYTTLLTVKQTVSSIPSDIQPFYDNGYHGLCNIEDYWPTNPHYHTTYDTIGAGYNNNAFATEVIKAEIAALSVLIKPYGVSGMPAVPTVIKPFNFARLPVLQPTLSFTSTDPQGDNIQYRVLWDEDPNFASPDSATTITYPSGSIANFVFPVPLQNGITYWWKVKCTDPGGTGLWTQYTERFSFTIGTSLPQNTCSWYQTTGAQFNYDMFNGTQVQGDSVVLLPSGQTIVDTLLNANFESGMPTGWTWVDGNNDGFRWTTGTTSDIGSYAPPNYGTAYAYYSDDAAGNGVINYNEELISPKIYIPPSATNLRINYGYGLRVYQSGEKMRVKFRKKVGGSWSAWTNIAEYTTNTNGTANIDLSGQLPCDSVQFEWFFSDSTASSHWGYACATDNVVITSSYTQSDFGTLTGTPVIYHNLSVVYQRNKWGDVVWHKATGSDSVGIQVEYYNGTTWQLIPNSILPGNATGFFTNLVVDTVKLTNVDTLTYHTLRVKGLFHRITKSPNTPSLLDWEVGNLSSYVVAEELDNLQFAIRNLQLEIYPNPFKNDLQIRYLIPDTRNQTNGVSNVGQGFSLAEVVSSQYPVVSIKIYDVTGRLVKLFSDFQCSLNNSVHSVLWDGSDDSGRILPSGIYFIKFQAEDIMVLKKVVHLK
ncbi:MAG: M28 family peptidase [bacterium]